MKLGFTTSVLDFRERVWLSKGIDAWTPWFKSGKSMDDNKRIDLVVLDVGKLPTPFPAIGEDIIVKNQKDKQGSFTHKSNIKELDGQSGWVGSIHFKAPQGDYLMWSIFTHNGSDGCQRLAGFAIPIIISDND